ncbi:MAG: HDOD domain-containing protein [Calditrichia bacterium]
MDLKNYINELEHIPTISNIALKVLQLLSNPEVNINEVTHIVEQDQALTGNILKVANSGYFEFMDEIKTIKKAIVLIGFKLTKEITSAFAVKSLFESLKESEKIDYMEIWKHALYSALFAQKLAPHFNIDPDEIYISALLHDIGIVVQLNYAPERFSSYLINQKNEPTSYYMIEKEQNSELTHDEIGFMLLQKWNLPSAIAIPVRWHHRLNQLPKELVNYQNPITCITLGNYFAHTYCNDIHNTSILLEDGYGYFIPEEMKPNIEDLFHQLKEEIEKEEEFLNLFY